MHGILNDRTSKNPIKKQIQSNGSYHSENIFIERMWKPLSLYVPIKEHETATKFLNNQIGFGKALREKR